MASGRDVGNARRDVDILKQRHYYTVMHWMSRDLKRQWTHSMDRTLWRNLGLFPFSIFGLVLNRTTLD